MLDQKSPRAGSARAVECHFAGDIQAHNIEALRTLVVTNRFALQPRRAAIVAGLVWNEAHG